MKPFEFPVEFRPSSRSLNRFITLGSVAMLVIGLALLYLLAQATSDRALFERNYARLFIANVVVASAIFLGVLWVSWKLYIRIRQKRFGSRLLLKLAVTFGVVGFAPGLLIYGVSYQFVSRSIESWFDARVQSALEAGLSLGRVSLDAIGSDLMRKTRSAAEQLALSPSGTSDLQLGRIADLLGADEVTLWSASGHLVASAGGVQLQLAPDGPSSAQLRLARMDRATVWLEGLDERVGTDGISAQVKVLAQVEGLGLGLNTEPRYLMVAHSLPSSLVANAMAVENVSREYQERALSQAGLKRMYIGTLTLGLFLAVFGALLLAMTLGNQIAQPLLVLAEGVEQVASGDLTPKLVWDGRDELGGLTKAFADMTQQLSDARKTVQHSLAEVETARALLQTILDNLTTGVLVFDGDGLILMANPGASTLLCGKPLGLTGRDFFQLEASQSLAGVVKQQFSHLIDSQEGSQNYWQQTVEWGHREGEHAGPFAKTQTLMIRGALLPSGDRLLVLDDITEVASAQRTQAWGEVARRLAHEIKNPLTPIQLSAERLEHRLAARLDGADLALLLKSVRVIVDQVGAMQRLVNEFRDFARLPRADLQPTDLNALVASVVALYELETASKIEMDLDERCPWISADAQQIRQVLHNLVQNGLEAQDTASNPELGRVRVVTQWSDGSGRVRLIIQDNGPGFSDQVLQRAFEPYVTTKQKGTGLGLAVVKKIADEHRARIEIVNRQIGEKVVGAQVSLSFEAAPSGQNLWG